MFNVIDAFCEWLGVGPLRLPPPAPSNPTVEPASVEDRSVTKSLAVVLSTLLASTKEADLGQLVEGSQLVRCRAPWEEMKADRIADADLQSAWRQIDQHGRDCTTLAWAETCKEAALVEALQAAVSSFQYEQTIITNRDTIPLPIGIVSFQAAVAANNILWRVKSTVAAQTLPPDPITDHWFSSAPSLVAARTGDLVVLFVIEEALERVSQALERHADYLVPQVTRAEIGVKQAEDGQRFWHFPARRRGVRRGIVRAQVRRRETQRSLEFATQAKTYLQSMRQRWQELSPLTRIRNGRLSGLVTPQDESGEVNTNGFTLEPLVADSGADGLHNWCIRQLLAASQDESGQVALAELFGALAPETDGPRSAESLAAWLFLARFYQIWARSGPSYEVIAREVEQDETRNRYDGFLRPWRQLFDFYRRHVYRRPFIVDQIEYQLQQEFSWFDKPLDAPESGSARLIITPLEKMREIVDVVFNVVRVDVTEVEV